MTNNDEPALNLEQIEWLHGAAEEAAAINLKMTMKPEEILQITSMLLALLAERDADKKQLESWRNLAKKNIEEHEKSVIALDDARQRIAELELAIDSNATDRAEFAEELGCAGDNESVLEAIEELKERARTAELSVSILEARTVSVKLPKPGTIKSPMGVECEVWERAEVESAHAAAGIKLEVGE